MKKTFTLLAALGIITLSFAQPSKNREYSKERQRQQTENRNDRYDRDGKDGREYDRPDFNQYRVDRYITNQERKEMIHRINMDYSRRLSAMNRMRFYSNAARKAYMRNLKDQRDLAIDRVNDQYRYQVQKFNNRRRF